MIVMFTKLLTKEVAILILAIAALSFSACEADLIPDEIGCVTCVDTQGITIEACADGLGNLTTTQNNDPSSALVTDASTIDEFREVQETQGSTCQ